jgi:hypothetical protein
MFGIGMGPSSQEKQAYGNLNSLAGFGSQHGQNDISQAESFFSSILSGDRGKQAQVLGPEIDTLKGQAQQRKNTLAEFGNRSGGTNASSQLVDDTVHGDINRMIDNLLGGAAGGLASIGENQTAQASGNYAQVFGEATTMQKQEQAKWNDIFKSIGDVAGTVAGFGPAGGMLDKIGSGIQSGLGG